MVMIGVGEGLGDSSAKSVKGVADGGPTGVVPVRKVGRKEHVKRQRRRQER